ncbi:MAG: hypothetical protein P8188_10075 [Gemmatimonadota bacterium]|jgi:hypothetical protein
MRKLAVVALLLALLPAGARAQGAGIGAKVGTLGYGVDLGIGLGGTFVLRGGVAFSPGDLVVTRWIPVEISGIDYALEPPSTTFSVGLEAHVLGPLKLTAGILYRREDLIARAESYEPVRIGNTLYDAESTIWATLDQDPVLPYFGLGLGRLNSRGLGVFLDLVVAYSSQADVRMTASPELVLIPGFTKDLETEADEFAQDAGLIKNFYPMLQFGLKIGLGGKGPVPETDPLTDSEPPSRF